VLNSSLSYTVSSSDRRIQYQSFEIPLERDTTVSRNVNLLENYSVLNAAHKHFIPSSYQQCQIPLSEDVLIEIFLTKTKRGKPEKLCHFWFNTYFLVEPKMQFILSNCNEKHSESTLGVLNSCLIPEFGHKYLYTMNKNDLDGLHKDKFHRLAPLSFTISVLFDYIPILPSTGIQPDLSIENKINTDLKLIEIVGPSGEDKLTITNNNNNKNFIRPTSRISKKKRTFNLYQNNESDWDSTDSESGNNETNGNYGEQETCQTHF